MCGRTDRQRERFLDRKPTRYVRRTRQGIDEDEGEYGLKVGGKCRVGVNGTKLSNLFGVRKDDVRGNVYDKGDEPGQRPKNF